MSRQYIGARYVPKFADPVEWSANKLYNESMIMVTYLNQTYTTRKPVPLGTPPTNTEYWALTGAVNEQLNEIQTDVNNLKTDVADNTTDINNLQSGLATTNTNVTNLNNKVTTAQTDITGLRTDVTTAQTDITGLRTDVTTAQTDITGLQNDNTAFNTKIANLSSIIVNKNKGLIDGNAILIGDSLALGNNNNLTIGWAYKLQKFINGNTKIIGLNGGGFTPTNTQPTNTFTSELANYRNSLTSEQLAEVKTIICFGGLNDVYNSTSTTSNISQGVTNLFNECKKFPNASIFIAPLNSYRILQIKFYNNFQIIATTAGNLGAKTTVQFIEFLGGFKEYQFDLSHLTDTGYTFLANNIHNWLTTGNIFATKRIINAAITEPNIPLVYSTNTAFYHNNEWNLEITGSINPSITTQTIIAKLIDELIPPYTISAPLASYTTTGSTRAYTPAVMLIYNNGNVIITPNTTTQDFYFNVTYRPLISMKETL